MKKCSKCKVEKELACFHKDKSQPGGYRYDCRSCVNIRRNKHRESNNDEYKKRDREYKKKNKEKIATRNKEYHYKKHYGISYSEFLALKESQNNCCAICKKDSDTVNGGLVLDHNHETGAVRGALCGRCNKGIGLLADSPNNLLEAFKYLNTKGHYGE